MSIKEICLPIFNPGKQIVHNGLTYVVDHVHVNGHELKIKFKELAEEIESTRISCQPTLFKIDAKLK